jgi:hypothetical protein
MNCVPQTFSLFQRNQGQILLLPLSADTDDLLIGRKGTRWTQWLWGRSSFVKCCIYSFIHKDLCALLVLVFKHLDNMSTLSFLRASGDRDGALELWSYAQSWDIDLIQHLLPLLLRKVIFLVICLGSSQEGYSFLWWGRPCDPIHTLLPRMLLLMELARKTLLLNIRDRDVCGNRC